MYTTILPCLYQANTNAVNAEVVTCITCNLKTQRNGDCGYNSILMNTDASFYVQTCLGPNIPEIVLRSVQGTVYILGRLSS